MKVCFFGGATGGIIGMNVFRHKTLKKEIFGRYTNFVRITAYFKQFHTRFLGFWTFF